MGCLMKEDNLNFKVVYLFITLIFLVSLCSFEVSTTEFDSNVDLMSLLEVDSEGWAAINPDKTLMDHPYLQIRELKKGNEVKTVRGWKKIKSIEYVEGEVQTYNLKTIEDTHTFFAEDVLTHNKGGYCFPAGTKISMADGLEKNIEDVLVGEKVLSYDEKLGEQVIAEVLELAKPVHYHMYHLKFKNENDLSLTKEHPLFVQNKGWASIDPQMTLDTHGLKVNKIELGDFVLDLNNNWVEIVEIIYEDIEEGVQTYNLNKIAGTATYYAEGMLVHNKGPPPCPGPGCPPPECTGTCPVYVPLTEEDCKKFPEDPLVYLVSTGADACGCPKDFCFPLDACNVTSQSELPSQGLVCGNWSTCGGITGNVILEGGEGWLGEMFGKAGDFFVNLFRKFFPDQDKLCSGEVTEDSEYSLCIDECSSGEVTEAGFGDAVLDNYNDYLTAYWNMNEESGTREDSVGDNDAVPVGSFDNLGVKSVSGKNGKAVDSGMESGTSRHLVVAKNRVFSDSGELAISLWFSEHNTPRRIKLFGDHLGLATNKIDFNGGIYTTPEVNDLIGSEWKHLVLVTSKNRHYLYLNGEEVGEGKFGGGNGVLGANLDIVLGGMGNERINLDEVGFWSGSQFSSQEEIDDFASALYNGGNGKFYLAEKNSEAGFDNKILDDYTKYLTAYWEFDKEGVGEDSVGNNDFVFTGNYGNEKGKEGESLDQLSSEQVEGIVKNSESISPSNSMATCFWINPDNLKQSLQAASTNILEKGSDYRISLTIADYGKRASLIFALLNNYGFAGPAVEILDLDVQTWSQVCFVKSGGNLYSYLNGEINNVGEIVIDKGIGVSDNDLILDRDASNRNDQNVNYRLDEMSFWKDIEFETKEKIDEFVLELFGSGTGFYRGEGVFYGEGSETELCSSKCSTKSKELVVKNKVYCKEQDTCYQGECVTEKCFNGVKDDNEEGIDCGSACKDCFNVAGGEHQLSLAPEDFGSFNVFNGEVISVNYTGMDENGKAILLINRENRTLEKIRLDEPKANISYIGPYDRQGVLLKSLLNQDFLSWGNGVAGFEGNENGVKFNLNLPLSSQPIISSSSDFELVRSLSLNNNQNGRRTCSTHSGVVGGKHVSYWEVCGTEKELQACKDYCGSEDVTIGYGSGYCRKPAFGKGFYKHIVDWETCTWKVEKGINPVNGVYGNKAWEQTCTCSANKKGMTGNVVAGDCVTPTSGMEIRENTKLCGGTYNLDKGLVIKGKEITLDCGGAVLSGAEKESGQIGIEADPTFDFGDSVNKIQNCELINWNDGIHVDAGVGGEWILLDNKVSKSNLGVSYRNGHKLTLSSNDLSGNNVALDLTVGVLSDIQNNNFCSDSIYDVGISTGILTENQAKLIAGGDNYCDIISYGVSGVGGGQQYRCTTTCSDVFLMSSDSNEEEVVELNTNITLLFESNLTSMNLSIGQKVYLYSAAGVASFRTRNCEIFAGCLKYNCTEEPAKCEQILQDEMPDLFQTCSGVCGTSANDEYDQCIQRCGKNKQVVTSLSDYDASLVGYWGMDEDSGLRKDSVNDNDLFVGTWAGKGGTIRSEGGIKGKAAKFDKDSSAILKTGAGASELAVEGKFAMSFWINVGEVSQNLGGYVPLVRDRDAYEFGLIHVLGGGYYFKAHNTGEMQIISGIVYPSSLKGWHHIGLMGDGVNAYVYINGELKGQKKFRSGFVRKGKSQLQIPFGEYIEGGVDEFGFWNGISLTDKNDRESFVKDLYNQGKGSFYVDGKWYSGASYNPLQALLTGNVVDSCVTNCEPKKPSITGNVVEENTDEEYCKESQYECGIWNDCGKTIQCGYCSWGEKCVNGQCGCKEDWQCSWTECVIEEDGSYYTSPYNCVDNNKCGLTNSKPVKKECESPLVEPFKGKFASSLTAYWNMDEESGIRKDGVGGNFLTNNNGVGVISGKKGSAASFDGVDDSLSLVPGVDLKPKHSYVLSSWIYLNEVPSETPGRSIISSGVEGSHDSYGIGETKYGPTGSFFSASSAGSSSSLAHVNKGKSVNVGWHHVVGVADKKNKKLVVYVDGKLLGENKWYDPAANGEIKPSEIFTIGYSLNEGTVKQNRYFSGAVDEVAFWKDIEFESDVERSSFVSELYNNGDGLFYSEDLCEIACRPSRRAPGWCDGTLEVFKDECGCDDPVCKQCLPTWNCGEWSECESDYDTNSLLATIGYLAGEKERNCVDDNGCVANLTETQGCNITVVINTDPVVVGGGSGSSGGSTGLVVSSPSTGENLARILHSVDENDNEIVEVEFVTGEDNPDSVMQETYDDKTKSRSFFDLRKWISSVLWVILTAMFMLLGIKQRGIFKKLFNPRKADDVEKTIEGWFSR
jgi:hypothetical protein